MLLAALLILVLIRGVETNSNSIHKNVVACVLLAELLFFVALKTRKTLVQHEVSADCVVLCACECVTGAGADCVVLCACACVTGEVDLHSFQ